MLKKCVVVFISKVDMHCMTFRKIIYLSVYKLKLVINKIYPALKCITVNFEKKFVIPILRN